MEPEFQLPYEEALAELRSELAERPRIARLIQAVAGYDELALYRNTKSMTAHEMLLHSTSSANAIRAFADKITNQQDTAGMPSATRTGRLRR